MDVIYINYIIDYKKVISLKDFHYHFFLKINGGD